MSPYFDPFIHISGYFLKCLTKQDRKCLTEEVSLHICSRIKHMSLIQFNLLFSFDLLRHSLLTKFHTST